MSNCIICGKNKKPTDIIRFDNNPAHLNCCKKTILEEKRKHINYELEVI
jgi:predicted RNA-binding protein YlxR (DUF448 family)